VDSPIVYQDIVHFQICSFSSRLIFKLDECILQTVPSLPVSYDICSTNAAELGENEFQILARGDRIELATPDNILGRFLLGVLQIPNHLKNHRSGMCFTLGNGLLDLLDGTVVLPRAPLLQLTNAADGRRFGDAFWRGWRYLETSWIVIWIIEDDSVVNADVLNGAVGFGVSINVVNFRQSLEPFRHLAEHSVFAIEVVLVVTQRDVPLGAIRVRACVRHSHSSHFRMFYVRVNLILEVFGLFTVAFLVGRLSPLSSVRGVARLSDEIALHVEEHVVVESFDLAELEKILARKWTFVNFQVDSDVPKRRL